MRDKERVKPFLSKFEKLWMENPDLRFGQLVYVLSKESDVDMFFLEEKEWLRCVDKFKK